MNRTLTLILFVSSMFTSQSILARTICVNPNGAPSCVGSIQAGINDAAPGDSIQISRGVYFENVVIPAGLDGLVVRGVGDASILDPQDPYGEVSLTGDGIRIFSSNVTIQALRLRNGAANGIVIDSTASGTLIR
jgi:hypothetical protein